MMPRVFIIALVMGSAGACETDADCDGDLACVIQADGFYSQCIDCTPDSFQANCVYWSEDILEAAEEACGVSECEAKIPTCAVDADCDSGETCVVESDNYAACVDCSDPSFQAQCVYWSDSFLAAAEVTCGIQQCDGKEPTCLSDADCGQNSNGNETQTCVTEPNGYAQCVDCASDSFQAQCVYWSASFLDAAEVSCGIAQCDAKVVCATDLDCPTPSSSSNATTCVAQADGLYAECVDCSPDAFQAQCAYWSEAILAAALVDCGIEQCDAKVPKCATNDDCTAGNATTCVIEEDTGYAQCVDCSDPSFQAQCVYWSDSFLAAAEVTCGIQQCDGKVFCATDADCSASTICVAQADGLYAQCVDCDPLSFSTQCVFWSDEILQAAQKDCKELCNTTSIAVHDRANTNAS